jgi:hypothetical protein
LFAKFCGRGFYNRKKFAGTKDINKHTKNLSLPEILSKCGNKRHEQTQKKITLSPQSVPAKLQGERNETAMGENRNPTESNAKTEILSKRTHYTASPPPSKREIIHQHLAQPDVLEVGLRYLRGQAILTRGLAGKIRKLIEDEYQCVKFMARARNI